MAGTGGGASAALHKLLQPGEYELTFVLGNIDDGRYANNGWLQEMPDPVTKLTWDNAVLMSPKTCDALGVNVGTVNGSSSDLPDTDFSPRTSNSPIAVDPVTAYPMVKITTPDGRSLELPVLVAPGQADSTLTVALGWGRTAPQLTEASRNVLTPPLRVAADAGTNVYQLRTTATPGFVTGVKVEKIDKTYPLAITQEHNSMEGRGLVREASLDKYHSDPDFVQEIGIDKDIPQGELTGYQKYEPGYIPPQLYSSTYEPERPASAVTPA
jgi:molybdopterin-containing oxidoreductase family iron-sulfur binding subunit